MSINNDVKTRISKLLKQVKEKKPLVHHITNYVTVNDCANAVLAIGGSPVMADDIEEVRDIVSVSSALVLNIGTLNERTIESMIAAGKRANELGIPVVLDPVGAGASKLRDKASNRIIDEVKLAVIRGNISEIKAISGIDSRTKGVDAAEEDMLSSGNLQYGKRIAAKLSRRLDCVVAITGPVDIVAGKDRICFIENGDKMLSMITGSGCMCTSIIAVYCGVADDYFDAAIAGVVTMGLAGEMARESMTNSNTGSGTFRARLIDSLSCITMEDIQKRGRVSFHESDYTLYLVTDRRLLRNMSIEEAVEQAVQGGATIVQLREKDIDPKEFFNIAVRVKKITDKYGIPLIINDRIDVALAMDAAGLHIGQDDIPAELARMLLDEGKILGVSASTVDEALRAEENGADYIGVGAIFPTDMKKDAGLVSIQELKAIVEAVKIPVVAIGGINEKNVAMLDGTGIRGVAVVSAIMGREDIRKAALDLKSELGFIAGLPG